MVGGGGGFHNILGNGEAFMATKERQSWAWAERTSVSKVQRWELQGSVREDKKDRKGWGLIVESHNTGKRSWTAAGCPARSVITWELV